MILAKDFEDFIRLLNSHQVEYMIVGGYALGFHGAPRYTGDIRSQMKNILGGLLDEPPSDCNVYCGSGSNATCKNVCTVCEPAGNGSNPNVKGGDKLCV